MPETKILEASDEEISRMVAAFRSIASLQQRMMVMDFATHLMTRDALDELSCPTPRFDTTSDKIRQQQASEQPVGTQSGNGC